VATDEGYLAHMNRVYAQFRQHLEEPGWYHEHHGDKAGLQVAYFSAEFGLHESLPIYSGGLGILAGRPPQERQRTGRAAVRRRAALPQRLLPAVPHRDGWQQENYPELDFYNLAVEPLRHADGSPVHVRVDLPDNAVFCKVWRANVGRVPLYLLDTNLQENAPADRDITARLYGTGSELRIKQELVSASAACAR
jgi:starch phosphorylase